MRTRTRAIRRSASCACLAAVAALAPAQPAPPPQAPADPPATIPAPAPDDDAEPPLRLRRVGMVAQPAAEIAAYDPAGRRAYIAGGPFAAEIDLRRPGYPGWVRQLDLSAAAGFTPGEEDRARAGSVTHVAIDPAGRNFAAATVCPRDFAARPGSVVLFHMPTAVILKSLEVGFSPDCLAFTPDGHRLIIANEGRPARGPGGEVIDPPGGLTIVDLSELPDVESLVRRLDAGRVSTFELAGPVVEQALTGEHARAVRIHPDAREEPTLDLEPESMALAGDDVYLTLQENNAIAVFSLSETRWTRLAGLGWIEQTIDASDYDGGIKIDRAVRGLPMPDQIEAFTVGGRTYLVTANEGADRGEQNDRAVVRGDRARLRDLARWDRLAPSLMSGADLSDPSLGRLAVSVFDGDEDADGRIETPVMFGTRSISIWDARTLERIGDTGPAFEQLMAERAKELFNAERIGSEEPPVFQFDARSPERGPEPEGLAVAEVAGRPIAFVTLERPGAIVAVDLSDPAHPRPFELVVAARDADIGAEGIVFVPAGQSASSEPMLLLCSEASGSLSVYRVMAR